MASKTTSYTLATFGVLIILVIGVKASWMAALCLSACLGEIWNVWQGYLNREVYSILGLRKRMVLYRERDNSLTYLIAMVLESMMAFAFFAGFVISF